MLISYILIYLNIQTKHDSYRQVYNNLQTDLLRYLPLDIKSMSEIMAAISLDRFEKIYDRQYAVVKILGARAYFDAKYLKISYSKQDNIYRPAYLRAQARKIITHCQNKDHEWIDIRLLNRRACPECLRLTKQKESRVLETGETEFSCSYFPEHNPWSIKAKD